MITKKNLKYRNQKFKSYKVNYLKKNKIMKGGANSPGSAEKVSPEIELSALSTVDPTDIDYSIIENNLVTINQKIHEQYCNFFDSEGLSIPKYEELLENIKTKNEKFNYDNNTKTLQTLHRNKWIKDGELSSGLKDEDLKRFKFHMVDLHGGMTQSIFIVPSNVCIILLTLTNNIGFSSRLCIYNFFNKIKDKYVDIINKRAAYPFYNDEKDSCMKMATWYYPSQRCYNMSLSKVSIDDGVNQIYQFSKDTSDTFINKSVNFKTNLYELVFRLKEGDPTKNHFIFLSSCRGGNERDDFDTYENQFLLDYTNRITNFSIEYYLSKNNELNKIPDYDINVDYFLKGYKRTLNTNSNNYITNCKNLGLYSYLYLSENKFYSRIFFKDKKINQNYNCVIPFLKYLNINIEENKKDYETFDYYSFSLISLSKQIKFIEKILEQYKSNPEMQEGIYNFIKSTSIYFSGLFLDNNNCIISYKNNKLDELSKDNFSRHSKYTETIPYYHFYKVGKLLLYYSLDRNYDYYKKITDAGINLCPYKNIFHMYIKKPQNPSKDLYIMSDPSKYKFYTSFEIDCSEFNKIFMKKDDINNLTLKNFIKQQKKFLYIYTDFLAYLRLENFRNLSFTEIKVSPLNYLSVLELCSIDLNDSFLNLNLGINLNEIKLDNITFRGGERKGIINIQQRSIRNLYITNVGAEILLPNLRIDLLKELYLQNVDFYKNKDKLKVLLGKCSTLERLTLINFELDLDLSGLEKELNVYYLKLEDCKNIKISDYKKLKLLNELILLDCPNIQFKMKDNEYLYNRFFLHNISDNSSKFSLEFRNIDFEPFSSSMKVKTLPNGNSLVSFLYY